MEKEQIQNLIKQGLTNKVIADKLGLNIATLRRRIKEYGLNRFNQKDRIITDEEKKNIINLYNQNLTCIEISGKLTISRITISKILKAAGIKIEKRHSESGRKKAENKTKTCVICDKQVGRRRNVCMSCYTNTRRFKIKKWMIEYKGGKCVDCGVSDLDISCYDFHHLDPNEKDFNLSSVNSARVSLEQLKGELNKCVLLCANCHRIKHSNYKNEKLLSYVATLKNSFLV